MLAELNQLLAFRREREERAALALRRARSHHVTLQEAVAAMEADLQRHHQERHLRQSQLYKQSLRSRLSSYQIDDLNIELDLMGEQTDALMEKLKVAKTKMEAAAGAVDEAAAVYQKHRRAGDRWNHLVDDVAEQTRLQQDQAEEFAIEDDLGDRKAAQAEGGW